MLVKIKFVFIIFEISMITKLVNGFKRIDQICYICLRINAWILTGKKYIDHIWSNDLGTKLILHPIFENIVDFGEYFLVVFFLKKLTKKIMTILFIWHQ